LPDDADDGGGDATTIGVVDRCGDVRIGSECDLPVRCNVGLSEPLYAKEILFYDIFNNVCAPLLLLRRATSISIVSVVVFLRFTTFFTALVATRFFGVFCF
jgi:hypothetical protein